MQRTWFKIAAVLGGKKAMYTLGLAINNARLAQVTAAEAAGRPLNPPIDAIPKKQTDKIGEPKQSEDKPKFPKQP